MKKQVMTILLATASLPLLATGSTHAGFVNAATGQVTIQPFKAGDDLHQGCATIQAQKSPDRYFWPITDEHGTPLRLPPWKVAREELVIFRMAFNDPPTQEVPVSDHCIYRVTDPALDRQFYLIHTAAAFMEEQGGSWQVAKQAMVERHFPELARTGKPLEEPEGPILAFRRRFVIFLGWRDQPRAEPVAWLDPLLSRATPAMETSPEEKTKRSATRSRKPALEMLPPSAGYQPAESTTRLDAARED